MVYLIRELVLVEMAWDAEIRKLRFTVCGASRFRQERSVAPTKNKETDGLLIFCPVLSYCSPQACIKRLKVDALGSVDCFRRLLCCWRGGHK